MGRSVLVVRDYPKNAQLTPYMMHYHHAEIVRDCTEKLDVDTPDEVFSARFPI